MEPNNQVPQPETPQMPPQQQPTDSLPETTPVQPKSGKKKKLIIGTVLLLIAVGAAVYFMMKPEDKQNDQTSQNNQSSDTAQQTDTEQTEEVEMKTTTYTSGLEHKTTAAFIHPASWEVTTDEDVPEGATSYSLKTMIIASPSGHYLHIYDRDGIGGNCDANSDAYTLYKEVATKTPNMYFKDFSVPSNVFQNHKFVVETEGRYSELAEHEALKEGESSSNTCNIAGFSTIGGSGVFLQITSSKDLSTSHNTRIGWDDIKDDAEFVKMIQSMVAVDKSGN
jgi:hypothetical protein